MEIITPGQIVEELQRLSREMDKGSGALYDAECRLADAEAHYDKQYSLAYLNSQGNIPDRQAVAKLQTNDDRLKADLARAEFNRVKQKMKMLSDQATMTAVMGRHVEMVWKHG